MIIDYLKGSKGKKSSPKAPTVVAPPAIVSTPDNLRSKDTVEVILGIAEGPIFGLSNGAKSFYVGDTQLQNENGDFNFKTFQLRVYPGEEDADPVSTILGGSSSNRVVNLELAYGIPVTRQTETGQIDFIDVRLVIQRLLRSDQTGTYTHSVQFSIEYKPLSGSIWTKAYGSDISISGKTTSAYVKEIKVAVPRIDEPYEIRITKLSPENTLELFSDIQWESFQETIAESKAYNNTAIVQLSGEASDQFSSIPSWSGIYKGLLVRIPSNYDPITRTYTGMWDGTFNIGWTNNPAWCTYDFIMNDRYGIKSYYPDINLDKYDVYDAAQWCDELVPDGRGGMHPRFTFNAYITEARSGKELARYMAGSFNATFFDDLNGTAYLRVDKDDDACHIFTQENIIGGEFEYSYTDITSRYNDITVTFKNPELGWSEDRRRVADEVLMGKNGRVPLDFIAVGCTNDRQALRAAHYRMIVANTETCMVSFVTNRLGQFVNPFDVMLICDPDMGYGISGRIKELQNSGHTVLLRTPIYLEAGVPYDIQFVLSDGSTFRTSLLDTTSGYNTTLNLSAPLDEDLVPAKTVFTLEHPTLIGLPRPFRVTKVEEVDGSPDQYLIEGININRNKWYDTDNLTDSGVVDYSVLPDPFDPPGPASVGFEEHYIKKLKQFQLIVSPFFNRGAYKYYANDHSFEVWSRLSGTNEVFVKRDLNFGDTIISHPPGLHDFKILGRSYLGATSRLDSSPIYTFNVTNPKEPPAGLDWIKVNQREIYWGYSDPPDDFAGYEVRYHNQENRTTFDDALKPHVGLLSVTSFYTNLIPPSARVIMVKAVDDFGVYSTDAAIIYRPTGAVKPINLVDETPYHEGSPPFAGTKIGCAVDPDDGELKADDTGTNIYSGNPLAQFYNGGNLYTATYFEMTYSDYFTVVAPGELIIGIDFDGSGYEVQIRPIDQIAFQPVPERLPLEAGEYEIKLRIFGGPTRGIVREFSAILDAPDITEDIQDLEVPPEGTIRVPLAKTYSVIKIVNVIIQDDGTNTAIGYRVLDKDVALGPEILLLDELNLPTGALVDVQIVGY